VKFFLTQIVLSFPLVAAYALFALGVVLIYRASRVLNLAHGAMAMLPGYLTYQLVVWGLPVIVAFVLGIASGGLLGAGVERAFVRRFRRISASAQTVGTVAVLGLIVAVVAKVWGTSSIPAPQVFPAGGFAFASTVMRWGQIGLVGVALLLTGALFALFSFTPIGLAMRGAADNRRAAALMGIDPDRTTRVAWIMGGALAAVAGILLAAVTSLHPYVMALQVLPAFVAALIGGLESMPGALAGAAVVGLATGVVPALGVIPGLDSFAGSAGADKVVLALLAFIVMYFRGQRFASAGVREEGL
jgi:branched-chain amino acid transport system permease protein